MKNAMKKTVIALLVGMGASAAVSAATPDDQASAVFQWAGTIPAATTGGKTKIVNVGTIEHDAGTLVFQEDSAAPGEFKVADSSELIFNVEKDGTPATSYHYEIQNLKFSHGGGLANEVDAKNPEFKVIANGSALVKGATPIDNTTAEDVRLTLETPSNLTNVSAGDEVVVQAAILVTGAA